jgi:fumarate hydratase class I
MPQYLIDHPVYYAGGRTAKQAAPDSFGPTTAGRSYVEQFQAAGGSLVMLAREPLPAVTRACQSHGGFLGSVGAATRLARTASPRSRDRVPQLGMEAVWPISARLRRSSSSTTGKRLFAKPGPLLTIGIALNDHLGNARLN